MKKVILILVMVSAAISIQAQSYRGMNGTDDFGALITWEDGKGHFSLKLFFENKVYIAHVNQVRVKFKDGSSALCNVDIFDPFGKEHMKGVNIYTFVCGLYTGKVLEDVSSFTLVSINETEILTIDEFKVIE